MAGCVDAPNKTRRWPTRRLPVQTRAIRPSGSSPTGTTAQRHSVLERPNGSFSPCSRMMLMMTTTTAVASTTTNKRTTFPSSPPPPPPLFPLNLFKHDWKTEGEQKKKLGSLSSSYLAVILFSSVIQFTAICRRLFWDWRGDGGIRRPIRPFIFFQVSIRFGPKGLEHLGAPVVRHRPLPSLLPRHADTDGGGQ